MGLTHPLLYLTHAQLILSTDPLPSNKKDFKKLFSILTDTWTRDKPAQVIIGCKMLSKQIINEIKFTHCQITIHDWLTKEKIFIELDSLGTQRQWCLAILPKCTHNLPTASIWKPFCRWHLKIVALDTTLASKLDPLLKDLYGSNDEWRFK